MKVNIRNLLAQFAAPFFVLFFFPLAHAGSFSLDANFVSVLLFFVIAILNIRFWLSVDFIRYFVIAPWLAALVSYLISMVFFGPRSSFSSFFAQLIFLTASIGLGSQIYIWMQSRAGLKSFRNFIVSSCVFLFVAFLTFAPPSALTGLVHSFLSLQPAEVVQYTRRAFIPEAFNGNVAFELVTNYQNRVAQFLYSYSFFVLVGIKLLQQRRAISNLTFGLLFSSSILMAFFSILLLSGQVLAEILIAVGVVSFTYLLIKPSLRSILFLGSLATASVALFVAILNTEFAQSWIGRFAGNNISTGRTERWAYYLNIDVPWTPFGLTQSQTLDPHNIYFTMTYDAGVFALIAILVFSGALMVKALHLLVVGARSFGFPFVLCASVGYQMVFVMTISGGFGFPGWSEFLKFGLFVTGVLLAVQRRAPSFHESEPGRNRADLRSRRT